MSQALQYPPSIGLLIARNRTNSDACGPKLPTLKDQFFPARRTQVSSFNSGLLPAGAMLYTVAICLLVAMLLSAMILLYSYTKLSSNMIYYKELAHNNLESGKNLILYGSNPTFGSFRGNLFGSVIDSYYVEMRPWGMYGILHSIGVHGPARAHESILFGEIPQEAFQASLYLEDRNRPLNLVGKTYLQGLAYLPEAGLRRGMVGKLQYEGAKLHEGAERRSSQQGCEVDFGLVSDVRDRLLALKTQGISGIWRAQPNDSITRDWQMPTLELRCSAPLLLKDIALRGNIVVTAPEVHVSKDARLQDILIFAQRIRVESGFKGRIQMFATDSLVVEEGCSLQYPSAAALASGDELGAILIGADSQLEGLVLADATLMDPRAKNQSYTQIAPKAEVIGTVIVPENLDLQGTVTGTVRTGKFRLISGGGVYENYLLDATIQHEGLSSQYAMPLLQSGHPQFMEILHLFSK